MMMTRQAGQLTRLVAGAAVAASVVLTLPRPAQAHDGSTGGFGTGPSRLAYRLGAGPVVTVDHLQLDGSDGQSGAAVGAVGDAFIGRVLSPYAATGIALRLSLVAPVEPPDFGDGKLERPGIVNAALLWQSDVDVAARVALRFGAGVAFTRLFESSGRLIERNAFGFTGLFGLPIQLWRYGGEARRTRFVPALSLARTLNGVDESGAFEGAYSFALSASFEIAFDARPRGSSKQ